MSDCSNHTLFDHCLAPHKLPHVLLGLVLHLHMQGERGCPYSIKPWPRQNCSVGQISFNHNEIYFDNFIVCLYWQLNHPLVITFLSSNPTKGESYLLRSSSFNFNPLYKLVANHAMHRKVHEIYFNLLYVFFFIKY